jgi:hypothetical protein
VSTRHKEDNEFPLIYVQGLNLLLMVAMTAVSWAIVTPYFAKGVLVGGLLANVSFMFLKNDLTRILAGPLHSAKARFFIKYYARFSLLALILFFLIRYHLVHVVGLIVGLSTVVLSIGITTIGLVKRFLYTAKEAS